MPCNVIRRRGSPHIKGGALPGPLPRSPFDGPAADAAQRFGALHLDAGGGSSPWIGSRDADGRRRDSPWGGRSSVGFDGRPVAVVDVPTERIPRRQAVLDGKSYPEDEDLVPGEADSAAVSDAGGMDPAA
jgi:hypothetical protein